MWRLTTRLGDVAAFESRQPVTAYKFLNKSSLFIVLLGIIRRLELSRLANNKMGIFSRATILLNRLSCVRATVVYFENTLFTFKGFDSFNIKLFFQDDIKMYFNFYGSFVKYFKIGVIVITAIEDIIAFVP